MNEHLIDEQLCYFTKKNKNLLATDICIPKYFPLINPIQLFFFVEFNSIISRVK